MAVSMSHGAVGASGDYAIVNGARYDADESIFGMHKEHVRYLLSEHIQPYETEKTDAINNGESFVTLTTNEIASGWGEKLEEQFDEDEKKALNPWTPKQIANRKLSISKKQQHGILHGRGSRELNFTGGVFDVCHCLWAIVLSLITLFVMLMWVVWEWTYEEVVYVVECFDCPTITDQVSHYMEKTNPSRSSHADWPKLHTNGKTNRIALNAFPYALAIAGHVAAVYEEHKKDGNCVITKTLAVFWRVVNLMRRGFGTLFKYKFDKESDGSTPQIIKQMIDDFRLATFIAYNLCGIMVCFYYFLVNNL